MANINRINSGMDYSVFFGGSSTATSDGVDLTSYMSIKNGSYRKLLNNYYSSQKQEAKSSVGDSGSKLTKIRSSADTLQNKADALSKGNLWETENTAYKVRKTYPEHVAQALPSDRWTDDPLPAAPLYRMAGTYLDYEKLLEYGIPGLQKQIEERKRQGGDQDLFSSMLGALELLKDCCLSYQAQALEWMEKSPAPAAWRRFQAMADALRGQGYPVARRTVAKYRKQLGIAP